jgi:hypothetical protein
MADAYGNPQSGGGAATQGPTDGDAPENDDAQIIAECMQRLQISISAESDNRREALDDLAFKKGEHWDPKTRMQRELDQRPCLTINKLPTFLHQVTNSQRQNVPSIKVHPTNEKHSKLAEIVQGGIRHVEYQSKADTAYDTAVNSAAAIGFGYFRLVTQYVRPDSFDQELAFRRIRNPFTVYMDPASVELDGSDHTWCILSAMAPRADFVANYPDADPCSTTTVRGAGDYSQWINDNEVRVAEYYRIKYEKAEVVLLSNGESGWKDKLVGLPEGVTVVKTRKSVRKTVQWFKITGVQVLERADIPCDFIPVFPVYGDETDINGKVYRSGLIRNAKDPSRMYDYWMTAATEEISLRPKAPYIGAEGQFEGREHLWAQANVKSFPYLEYKPKALAGMMAPPPQRQPMADLPVGVLQMAMHANDDIKATTGIFDASLGARSNETSGVAIGKRDRQGETANYHYTDNLNITLRHAGRCMLNMWPKVYDSTRTLKIMAMDASVSTVEINKPGQEEDEDGQLVDTILNDMQDVMEFAITVSVGPSYDTLRQEAVDGMIATAQSWPKLMDIAGDKVVRSMDWPMSDDIADRIEKTIPPELRKGEKGADEDEQTIDTPMGPIPVSQAPEMLQQVLGQMQQMQQDLDKNASAERVAQIKAESAREVAEIGAVQANDVAELNGLIKLLVAKLQPPPVITAKALETGENSDQRPTGEAAPPVDLAQQGASLTGEQQDTGPETA